MKKIICILISVLLIGSIGVLAEEGSYKENYKTFGAEKLKEITDNKTKSILEENGIDPENENFINNLKVQNVFSYIFSLFKGGFKKPFKAVVYVIVLIIVLTALTSFWESKTGNAVNTALCVSVILLISKDLWNSLITAVDAIKTAASFMIGFIPIFIGLTAAQGKTVSAAGMGGTLLLSANFVSSAAAFLILPLLGGHLSLSMAAGVSPLIESSGLATTLKKISLWILSLTSTVFLGVLSLQNTVNSAADNVALKTAKFILGTSVPVAGTAVSEAMSGVVASLSFLRSGVAIYAVIALFVMLLPCLADIVLWRLSLNISSGVASLFGNKKLTDVLKAIDSTLACLLGILVLCLAVFVISLTVVLK